MSIYLNNLCGGELDKISMKMLKYDIAIPLQEIPPLEIQPMYIPIHDKYSKIFPLAYKSFDEICPIEHRSLRDYFKLDTLFHV